MFEWDVPLADAENGKAIQYRLRGGWSPDFVNITGHVVSFAIGQCSYETKRKHISNGDPILLTAKSEEHNLDELKYEIVSGDELKYEIVDGEFVADDA